MPRFGLKHVCTIDIVDINFHDVYGVQMILNLCWFSANNQSSDLKFCYIDHLRFFSRNLCSTNWYRKPVPNSRTSFQNQNRTCSILGSGIWYQKNSLPDCMTHSPETATIFLVTFSWSTSYTIWEQALWLYRSDKYSFLICWLLRRWRSL